MGNKVVVVANAAQVAQVAAGFVASAIEAAVEARGACVIALAGGSTPQALYERLAGAEYAGLPWDKVQIVFGDERAVPADHPDSNYGMAKRTLLDHVPIPASQVHAVPTAIDPPKAGARAYDEVLRGLPRLDLALLGLGADGHTASLFPGSPALDEAEAWVTAPFVEAVKGRRYTLTVPAFAAARELVFLVSGEAKAAAAAAALEGPEDPQRQPAQRVARAHGQAAWLIDRAAAKRLKDA